MPAWDVKNARSKSEVVRQAKKDGKNSSLREFDGPLSPEERRTCRTPPEIQGASCASGETNVKDEEGYRAVFTEQGSSASQMAAARFLNTISKVRGMAGETSDAISAAYTQAKMTEAPRLLRLPKEECPEIWIRIPQRNRPKSWDKIDDPVVSLERNLFGYPLAGFLWERNSEEVLFEKGWEKVPTWVCLHVHTKLGSFLIGLCA